MERSTLKNMKFGKDKLKTFWFYYRWHILIGGVLLIIAAALITQCSTKEDKDFYVYYAGPSYFSPEMQDKMEQALAVAVPDELGKTVGFYYTRLGKIQNVEGQRPEEDDGKYQEGTDHLAEYEAVKDFSSRMHQPATVICLLAPKYYETAVEEGWLAPLSAVTKDLPAEADQKGYGIPVGTLSLYDSNSVFKNVPEDTMLCFAAEAPALMRTGTSYENQKKVFAALLEFGNEE